MLCKSHEHGRWPRCFSPWEWAIVRAAVKPCPCSPMWSSASKDLCFTSLLYSSETIVTKKSQTAWKNVRFGNHLPTFLLQLSRAHVEIMECFISLQKGGGQQPFPQGERKPRERDNHSSGSSSGGPLGHFFWVWQGTKEIIYYFFWREPYQPSLSTVRRKTRKNPLWLCLGRAQYIYIYIYICNIIIINGIMWYVMFSTDIGW